MRRCWWDWYRRRSSSFHSQWRYPGLQRNQSGSKTEQVSHVDILFCRCYYLFLWTHCISEISTNPKKIYQTMCAGYSVRGPARGWPPLPPASLPLRLEVELCPWRQEVGGEDLSPGTQIQQDQQWGSEGYLLMTLMTMTGRSTSTSPWALGSLTAASTSWVTRTAFTSTCTSPTPRQTCAICLTMPTTI